jgi:hypothetical protein
MGIKNKRGALSMRYIVIFIALIISLGAVLLFYLMYDWQGEIDKQACHQSVIYKATVPELMETKVAELPLNCETEKICITTNAFKKGNCDDDYLGEKYQTVRISKDESEEEINKVVADKLYECWWMMGEGKVQIYSRTWGLKEEKKCNICTRIAFAEDLKGKEIRGYQRYLTTNVIEGSDKTYWQYITNSDSNYIHGYSKENDSLSTTIPYAFVFGEVSGGALDEWFPVGGTVAGAVVGAYIGSAVPIVGTIIGAGVGGLLGYWVGEGTKGVTDYFQGDTGEVYGALKLIPDNIDNLKKLGCFSFEGQV